MRNLWCAAALCLLHSGLAPAARAESIWQRRSQRYGFLFNDQRARNVGDILTVLIAETNAINQREQRQLKKATDTSAKLDYKGSTASDNGGRTGALSFEASASSNRAFDGNAQFTSGRQFTDTLTATVVDVLPNGNLVIEGHRIRVVSGEQRLLRVTGLVRPADLSAFNSVPSAAIANFKIEYCGRGVDTNTTTRGWLGRAFDYVWPF
ncbi:MAG: flagellar basal body L-ring protein FlgH [Gemmataceae bacterium]|nr:flagellar basal body L-ring protein FlgH [Gemmataceae bacterium]